MIWQDVAMVGVVVGLIICSIAFFWMDVMVDALRGIVYKVMRR